MAGFRQGDRRTKLLGWKRLLRAQGDHPMRVKKRHVAACWAAWLALIWAAGSWSILGADQVRQDGASAARQARGNSSRAGGATPSPASTSPQPKTFYSRYRRFGLPITVLQAPFQIRTVQLHLSTDGGATWRTYAEEPATRQEFVFETPQDGEYWFASKTVDVQNTVRPSGPTRAEQHVVIDTEDPQLELRADVTARGTVRISWRVADRNLDPHSLSVEYQAPPRDDWVPIELPSDQLVADRGVMEGQFDWQPNVTSRVVFLSARVKDMAGNVAAESTRVYLPRVAARARPGETPLDSSAQASPPRAASESRNRPDALLPSGLAPLGETASNPRYAPRHGAMAGIPWPEKESEERDSGSDRREAGTSGTAQRDGRVNPSEAEQGWAAAERARLAPEPSAASPEQPVDSAEKKGNESLAGKRREHDSAGPGRMAARATQWPDTTSGISGDVRPQVAERVPLESADSSPPDTEPAATGSGRDEKATSGSDWPDVPAGESLRMTRSRRFYLEYDIESAGPEGVAEVELWATQDGGQTWEKWGVDADKQSPLDVQVDEEGVYGFRIVVVGRNGLAAAAPQPGAPADLWIGVDWTPPSAEITAVVYGTGARSGELDIRWIAEDRRLSDRPITLSFSESREGPWTTIATGLPNSGQYFWKLDGSIPMQIYLRIQCQDEAGNSTEFIIREPVNTAGLSPKGRIRGFRPAEGEREASTPASGWFPFWRR
jgi:hypothetical protein